MSDFKTYVPLPKGHPADVVWLTLCHARYRNVRDPEDPKKREYKFRAPVDFNGGTPHFCTPVPLRLGRRLLSETHNVAMAADSSGRVQSDALRAVPTYAQSPIPADWPKRLRAAKLLDGAGTIYPAGSAALLDIDPEVAAERAAEAAASELLEKGRRMITLLGPEAVGKLIDAGELPEALRDELVVGANSDAAKIVAQDDWRDVLVAVEALTDLAVLDEVAKLEQERKRPRNSVLRAVEATRNGLAPAESADAAPTATPLDP